MSAVVIFFIILFAVVILAICLACCMRGNTDNADQTTSGNRRFTRNQPSRSIQLRNEYDEDAWNRDRLAVSRNNRAPYPTSDITSMPSVSRAPYPTESDEAPNRPPYPTSSTISMPMPSISRAPYPTEPDETSNRVPYPTSNRTSMPMPSVSTAPYSTAMPVPSTSRAPYPTETHATALIHDSNPLLISTTITPAPSAPTNIPFNANDPPPSYSEAMRIKGEST